MRKSVVAVAALLLLATGCGSNTSAADGPTGNPTAQSSSPDASGAPEAAAEDSGDAGFSTPAEFGETISFPAGIDVVVKAVKLRDVTDDDGVVYDPGDKIAEFAIQVTNKTSARLDAGATDWASTSFGEGFSESGMVNANADLGAIFPGETGKGKFERILPGYESRPVRVSIADPSGVGQPAVFEGVVK